MATPDTKYWAEVEQDIVERLCNRYGITESHAKDIINMVESMCSTRGAALMWIDQYINSHELL